MTDFHMTDARHFAAAFNAARETSETIKSATSPFTDGSTFTRYYLSDDRQSGFAVRSSGELVYVFSLVKGRGDDIVSAAADAGATHLDCFDGYLPTLYSRHGFAETWREPNWSADGPDVVYMTRPNYIADGDDAPWI